MSKNANQPGYQPAWKSLQEQAGTQSGIPYAGQARPEIDVMLMRSPQRILDVGCSTGAVGERLKHQYPQVFVWGVEIGAAADEAERRLDRVSRIPPTEFGAEEIALLSSVDTVLMLDVLEHMYDPWKALAFLANHLAQGAQMIVSLPNAGHANVICDLADGYWHYQDSGLLDVTHIRFFTLFEMRKMFYETGFRILKTHFPVDYCVDPGRYPPQSFPAWVDFGGVKLIAQNHEHFLSLNSRQIFFSLELAADAGLSSQELAFRHAPHPKTRAF